MTPYKQPGDPPVRTTGAARHYAEQEIGGPTREQESFPTVQTTVGVFLNNNGDRVGLTVFNNSTNPVWIGVSSNVAINVGINLPAGGGGVSLTLRDDWTLIGHEWYAIASTAPVQIYVLETISDIVMAPEQA